MARWLIQLEGDQMDLDEFPYWFPNGDVYAIEENGTFYLVGPAFEMLSEPDQVHEAALQAVHEFYGIASLLWSSLRRPEVGIVFREDERGKREGSAFLSGSATLRSKARGTLTTGGGAQHRRSPTTARLLLSGSWRDKHIRTALDLWADPLRTWPRLYLVLEVIEKYLGQEVQDVKFCSRKERERFRRSANSMEIAGKDARHARRMHQPPKYPMRLPEATEFIRGLLLRALDRAAAAKPQPPETS